MTNENSRANLIWQKLKWALVGALTTVLIVFIVKNLGSEQLKKLGLGTSADKLSFTKVDPEFAQYISAYTTGYISSASTIKIRLQSQLLETVTLHTPVSEKYFSFDDDIDGETTWLDAQTLEFRPKEKLKAGESYRGTFYLGRLTDVKSELKEFEFNFMVVDQSIKIEFSDLRTYGPADFNYFKSSGTIYAADAVESSVLESILNASFDGEKADINWKHEGGNIHHFWIDSLERGKLLASTLKYKWDGAEIGVKDAGTKSIEIPSKGTFSFLNVGVVNSPDQCIQIAFSNPLDNSQSVEGLVVLKNLKDVKLVTENNLLKIYPNEIKSGKYRLKIEASVRDANMNRLDKDIESEIVFEEIKPAIKFIGTGAILPSGSNSKVVFEAVNLKAVSLTITKIFENNMLQFLQENNLDGASEMARVGKRVLTKVINLGITNPADFKRKKRFSVDIGNLIKTEPGAIYHLKLTFKKAYSAYSCGGSVENETFEMESVPQVGTENDYVYFSDYEYEGDEEYDWDQRDNPCNGSFYNDYRISATKNILASDLGLSVKKSNDGTLFFATSDIITAAPKGGVEIELYDYQQQLITTSKTNSDGMLFLKPDRGSSPYFIVAKNDKQRAYVKLEDGASLSLSMFDVGGETVQRGLKGFIYGERGVWRPGDTIFLTFILEDKLKTLPTNHPIVLELRNPQGMIYKKLLKSKGQEGFYTFPVTTDVNAPTGNWMAVCKVGANEFTKNIRVETVMPNRLKIKVSAGDDKILGITENERMTLHANWLTGPPARNMRATIAVALNKSMTEFPKYKKYVFDDPTARFESQNLQLFDGRLNENGDASFALNIKSTGSAPGMLKAAFVTRVTESGGAFSVDRFSIPYSPYRSYVGIQLPEGEKSSGILYTGREHQIRIATVNAKGQPVSKNRIKAEVYKLSWRWWWDQYEDELANFTASDYNKPIFTTDMSTDNGEGSFAFSVKEDDWGRYLIRVSDPEGGHSTAAIAYFDSPGWMERSGSDNRIVASLLQFTSDKQRYGPKEEAVVNIPSPKGGRALITIETGSKILQAHWLETEKGNTKFKFTIDREMAPSAYVHVSLLQPHGQVANDLPIRLYGVIPIQIDDPQTHLRPVLNMPATLAPETQVPITISEENGKEMVYTVAMVDDGLLDLTRFKTPDLWQVFYAREALGIKTWDMYDYVIGAYGGELERILSIGGDGTEINRDAAKANRFKPMVKFLGPFTLKKGETQKHMIQMPMYIGSVRTMVIAGYEGAYGSTDKTTPVKSPIMLLGTLPRVLSIDEEVNLPVSVFGGESDLQNVTISVVTNSLLQITGPSSQITDVKKNDERDVVFRLKVKSQTGVAKVNITAVAGSKKTNYSMELDVRNPNPFQTDVKEYIIESGKTQEIGYTGIGIPGTNSGALELSTIPALNLESRLRYLVDYPHGCIEQTASSAFAQLYLDELTELSPAKKNEIETNIRGAITGIQKFQRSDGSFSYWPGENSTSDWGSVYAGHFLLCAEKKGYTIPVAVKQNLIKYLQTVVNTWEPNKFKHNFYDYVQAYRLFVLALAGKPSLGAMNRFREFQNLSVQAKWKLAAAYAAMNNLDIAEKVISGTAPEVAEYKVDYLTYGSSQRDDAVILEALCMIGNKSAAVKMLHKVTGHLSGKRYLSTQSSAYCLLAVAAFEKSYGNSSAMQARVTMNGRDIELSGNAPIHSSPVDFSKGNSGSLKIENTGKGPLFVRLINRGKPPVGSEKEEENNLSSEVVFRNAQNEIITPDQLKQGTDFKMEVTIRNPGTMGELQNLALMNYIPSGWEIHNSRMDETESASGNAPFDYQDIRDDKILTYFGMKPNETKTFRFNLNAAYAGTYYLPGINIEAMYDNSVFSRKKGSRIKVGG
jgi:alpha-2-macroglobulin